MNMKVQIKMTMKEEEEEFEEEEEEQNCADCCHPCSCLFLHVHVSCQWCVFCFMSLFSQALSPQNKCGYMISLLITPNISQV